jgi:hypothetical protein
MWHLSKTHVNIHKSTTRYTIPIWDYLDIGVFTLIQGMDILGYALLLKLYFQKNKPFHQTITCLAACNQHISAICIKHHQCEQVKFHIIGAKGGID